MLRLFEWMRDIQKKNRTDGVVDAPEIKLNEPCSLRVNAALDREFGHLLGYVTSGKFVSFDNFKKIADNFVEIDAAIAVELGQRVLREEKVNCIDHDDAVRNMRNLQSIVKCIAAYVESTREFALPGFRDSLGRPSFFAQKDE